MATPTFNIADLFEMVTDTVPEREALVCGSTRVTFSQLEERSNRLAHFMKGQGIKAGDHVGLYMYNCAEYLESMLACFKLRAVPVNVNYRYVSMKPPSIKVHPHGILASVPATTFSFSTLAAPRGCLKGSCGRMKMFSSQPWAVAAISARTANAKSLKISRRASLNSRCAVSHWHH